MNHLPYMLRDRYFSISIFAALLLHISGFVAWNMTPKTEIRDIQIRKLNIRFGDVDDISLESANIPQLEEMVTKISEEISSANNRADSVKNTSEEIKQYVREISVPSTRKNTVGMKNGEKNAEMVSRYTQVISLWIQKFKQYPEEARAKNIQGSTKIRIRIDRRGNIRYKALEKSTGSKILDMAAIEMINMANPVPAVPSDYLEGEVFEFLIPVSFSFFTHE